jgi:hypothetical protein
MKLFLSLHVRHMELAKHIHKDKPILSSERLLHKNYGRKGSVEKKSLVVSLKELGAKTK